MSVRRTTTTRTTTTTRGPTRPQQREIMLESKAWFLCKFLSRTLDEEICDRIRYHISICKGVKTRIKLSSKGLSAGYKVGSFRNINHKLPYEFFPLDFIEGLQQDSMFVNVLLGVFRLQNVPDIQYEIIVYKFKDSITVKKFQEVFQLLTGSEPIEALRAAGSTLTLVQNRPAYQASTLPSERWMGTRERLPTTGSAAPSELRMQDPGLRGERQQTNGKRMVLDSEGSWSDGSSLIEDTGPVFRTQGGTVVAPSSTYRRGGGRNNITLTSVDSYDEEASPRSLDVVDSVNHKVFYKPPSDRGRSTLEQRGRYQYNDNSSYYGRSRSYDTYGSRVGDGYGSRMGDNYGSRMGDGYGSRMGNNYGTRVDDGLGSRMGDSYGYRRGPQEDPYGSTYGRRVEDQYGSVMQRNGYYTSDRSDVVSVKSQSSYLLAPNFRKVYAPRSSKVQNGYVSDPAQYPRAYAGSEIRRNNDRW